ncbi:MAG: hypothetical protein ACUVT7_03735 [Thermoplasmata archaeon]
MFIGSGIGVLMNENWWRTLAIISSAISIVAIVPWWDTVVGAKAGVAMDFAIILVLLLSRGEEIAGLLRGPSERKAKTGRRIAAC